MLASVRDELTLEIAELIKLDIPGNNLATNKLDPSTG